MMVPRFLAWTAALALAVLIVTDVDACGRRRRGGSGGTAFFGGGCSGCSDCSNGFAGGYGFTNGFPNWSPAWSSAGPSAWSGPVLMPNQGEASAAILADRLRRQTSAVFAIDPATGVLHQVGWLNPDGTLRPLRPSNEPEGGAFGTPPPASLPATPAKK